MIRPAIMAVIVILSCLRAATGADDLARGFAAPPDSAKPRVYWWWLNSRVSREGITRDLEAYRAKGVGGVLLCDAGGPAGPMPSGPRFMGAEWRELYKHALREADRLGLEVSLNLCSGWCAGGPWIDAAHAAKHVVQSTLSVAGPKRLSAKLPAPPGERGTYRDVLVQAFREQPIGGTAPPLHVTASSFQENHPPQLAADGDAVTCWVSAPRSHGDAISKQRPEWLQFDFARPITVTHLLLMPRHECGPREIEVQVSGDGRRFTTVKTFALGEQDFQDYLDFEFPVTTSRCFRILINGSYRSDNVQICESLWGDDATIARRKLLAYKSGRDSWPCDGPTGTVRALVDAALPPLPPDSAHAPIDPQAIVDLTARLGADGQLQWDVPPGQWTIVRTGYTITGVPVSLPSPGGEGLEMDWLNRAAMDHHFQSMAAVLCQDAGPLLGKTLKYLHDDSWEAWVPNWSEGFLEEFQRRRGYDARPFLPVLTGRTVRSAEVSDRFLYDFRKTIADCIANNHYSRLGELARGQGLKIHCEAGGPCWPKAPPMDGLMNLGRCDIPMAEFWQSHHWKEHGQSRATKQAACAAHLYGKQYAAAEAFTKLGRHYEEDFANMKPTADTAWCEGINRFIMHTSTSSRPEDGMPGFEYYAGTHFNRNVTWWDQSGAFLTYIARCQYLLQQGMFVADVLYYNGDGTPNFVEPKHVDPSLGPGYDYDACNSEVLLARVAVHDGRLVLPDGMSYRLLALPDRRTMPLEVLRKIAQLVAAGATVVGPTRPQQAPGLKDYPACDEEVKRLADSLWDGGKVIAGKTLRETLSAAGVPPDFEYGGDPGASLDFIHRRTDGAEIYFVANCLAREETRKCTFRVDGKVPELWNPVTGQTRDAVEYTSAQGRTTLPIEFAPHGSWFVVFRKPSTAHQTPGRNFAMTKGVQTLDGPWNLSFDPAWGGPKSIVFEKLDDWSKRPEEGVRYYSGKATYAKTFDLVPAARSSRLLLDLGHVKSVAAVRLNGKDLGIVWCAPWRVDVSSAVQAKDNRLEIDVVNVWANRLIGDAALPEERRFTKTNVRTYTKDSPLLESGLLGPVVVQAEESLPEPAAQQGDPR